MRRRVLIGSVSFTTLLALSALVHVGYRNHEAQSLLAQGRAKLMASFEDAPGLDRLSASSAISLLNRAQEKGAEGDELMGLLTFARGIEDFQRGDLVLAEQEITAARHILGWTADLRVLASAIARGRSEPEAAEEHLQAAFMLEPSHARGLLLGADLALDNEDGPSALSLLNRLIEQEPQAPSALNRRGLAHELVGDLDAAESDFRDAIRFDERAHDAWINLGRLRRRGGHHAEALRAFEHAVTRAPTDSDARLGRGLSRAALGQVEGARDDFERAAELAPNDAEPLLALGDLERDLGAYESAVATYRRAIAAEDADAASFLKLGNALTLLEHYEEASRSFRQALHRVPELSPALNGLGAALMHLDEAEGAEVALSRAAELDAQDPNPLMNLALLRERQGRREDAIEAWSSALIRDPNSAIARRHLTRLQG